MKVQVAILLGDGEEPWVLGNIRQHLLEDPFCKQYVEHPVRQLRTTEEAEALIRVVNPPQLLVTVGVGSIARPPFDELAVRGRLISYPYSTAALMANVPLNGATQTFDPTKFRPPVVAAVRKRASKLLMASTVDIRLLRTQEELADYARLRYQVWTERGYIQPGEACEESRMEIDWADNQAIPVGAFVKPASKPDGAPVLVGCARLITAHPQEPWRTYMSRVVAERKSPTLTRNFQLPVRLENPYDMLDSFPNFTAYYQRITREEISEAELSRVIVLAEERKRGIGEALVDFAAETARERNIDLLFLACRPDHASFYARCGFSPIAGMTCEAFAKVRRPSIAMQLPLTDRARMPEGASL